MKSEVTLILLITLIYVGKSIAQQSRPFFLDAAIHLTGDAEMVFIGPSFGAGAGLNLGKRFSVSTTYTFFSSKLSNPDERFRTHTVDITPNFHFHNVFNPAKGLYFGFGVARQFRKQTPEEMIIERPSYWAAVFNAGYRFPTTINKKPRSLSVDLKATGPYFEQDPAGDYIEILTQLMLGIRFRY